MLKKLGRALGRVGGTDSHVSSLGPNTTTASVGTGSVTTVPAYGQRGGIRLTIDPAASTNIVYGLCGSGTPSATNFHFALAVGAQGVWDGQISQELWTGAIQLIAVGGTVKVGVLEA